MGAGTQAFNRPGVFRIVVSFVANDGRTPKPLDSKGDIYRQFVDRGLPELLQKLKVEGRWEDVKVDSRTKRVRGATLLLLGETNNGNISASKATEVNCGVALWLGKIRVRQVNSRRNKKKTLRKGTGVGAVVVDNIGPAASETGPVGTHHGPCRDCCLEFRVTTWEP